MRSDFARGDKTWLLWENSLRRHIQRENSRDVSTASRDCSRGSALNMTSTGRMASLEHYQVNTIK